jgi:hypothetical protein
MHSLKIKEKCIITVFILNVKRTALDICETVEPTKMDVDINFY